MNTYEIRDTVTGELVYTILGWDEQDALRAYGRTIGLTNSSPALLALHYDVTKAQTINA